MVCHKEGPGWRWPFYIISLYYREPASRSNDQSVYEELAPGVTLSVPLRLVIVTIPFYPDEEARACDDGPVALRSSMTVLCRAWLSRGLRLLYLRRNTYCGKCMVVR